MNGWKAVLEINAIPFGVAYAVVTYFQWRDLRHNFAVEERALIKVAIDPKQGDASTSDPAFIERMHNIQVPVHIQNIGKNPATKVRAITRVELLPRNESPDFSYASPGVGYSTYDLNILFPTDTSPMPVTMYRIGGFEAVLTEEERKSLLDGSYYLVYYGKLTYSDGFGEHWTLYCGWHGFNERGTYTSRPCSEYNAIDHN
jgi:hypothetical protein